MRLLHEARLLRPGARLQRMRTLRKGLRLRKSLRL
jgi:hypothetical protein